MRRTLLCLSAGLGILVYAATLAHAQHGRGSPGGGFGGRGAPGGGHGGRGVPGGGYGNRPSMHPQYQPRIVNRPGQSPSNMRFTPSARPAPSGRANTPRPRPGNLRAARPSSRTSAATALARLDKAAGISRRHGKLTGQSSAALSSRLRESQRGKDSRHSPSLTGRLSQNGKNGRLAKRELTTADNKFLNDHKNDLSSSLARNGIDHALAGKPMTPAEARAVQAAIDSGAVSGTMKATLNNVLQTDRQIKRELATNNALNSLANAALLGGMSGGIPLGGGGVLPPMGVGDGGYPPVVGPDSVPPAIVPAGPGREVIPAVAENAVDEEAPPVSTGEGGVPIQEVTAGAPADAAGLRAGDVILSFGDVRTRTFDDLQSAVQSARGPVKVVFINGENGQTEYLQVEPEDGRIGVTCE